MLSVELFTHHKNVGGARQCEKWVVAGGGAKIKKKGIFPDRIILISVTRNLATNILTIKVRSSKSQTEPV